MNFRPMAVTALIVGLTGLAACSSPTGATSPAQSSHAPSSAAAPAGGSLSKSIKPCDLLDSSVLKRNGLTSSGNKPFAGARTCTWTKKVTLNAPGYVIGADIWDTQGIADYNSAGYAITNDPIGHHQVIQAKQTDGDLCDVTIGITKTSRVDISANISDPNITRACALANKFAKLIEPKVP